MDLSTYRTITPHGRVTARFIDGAGLKLDGPSPAVEFLGGILGKSLDAIEPDEFMAACAADGSGVLIETSALDAAEPIRVNVFKSGDKVVCIDDGRDYTVTGQRGTQVSVKGRPQALHANRLKPASGAKPQTVMMDGCEGDADDKGERRLAALKKRRSGDEAAAANGDEGDEGEDDEDDEEALDAAAEFAAMPFDERAMVVLDGDDAGWQGAALDAADLGPVFTEFKGDPAGAIKKLLETKSGDARAVVSRPGIGEIDLIWGGPRYGLSKIAARHPEALSKLPGILKTGKVVMDPGGKTAYLMTSESASHVTVVRLEYFGQPKAWVLTSYEDKKGKAAERIASIDTESSTKGGLDAAGMDCRPRTLSPDTIFVASDPAVKSALTAIFDGDFPGHPFRGNQHKKASHTSKSASSFSRYAKGAERHGDTYQKASAHHVAATVHKRAAAESSGKTKRFHQIMAKFHAKQSKAGRALLSDQDRAVFNDRHGVVDSVGDGGPDTWGELIGLLDGDFPGHPFRGNQYVSQHAHSGAASMASRVAKRAETSGAHGNRKKAAHRQAAIAHRQAGQSARGKKARAYHRKMARFHESQAGIKRDDAAIDFEHDVGEAADVFDGMTPMLDGDFPGHPFRGNQYVAASASSGAAVHASMRAKHAEHKGGRAAQRKTHRAAYHAHKAAMEEASTRKARSYHRTMARFHRSRAGVGALDSVDHDWHRRTQEKFAKYSEEQLRFVIKDATEAADLGEKIGNPKVGQYRDEVHYAHMELNRRKKAAAGRAAVKLDGAEELPALRTAMSASTNVGRRIELAHAILDARRSRDGFSHTIPGIALANATPDAIKLLTLAQSSGQRSNAYRTAVAIEREFDRIDFDGLTLRWEAVSPESVIDSAKALDASGDLFGEGEAGGYLACIVSFDGVAFARIVVRGDGTAKVEASDRAAGWNDNGKTMAYVMQELAEDTPVFSWVPGAEYAGDIAAAVADPAVGVNSPESMGNFAADYILSNKEAPDEGQAPAAEPEEVDDTPAQMAEALLIPEAPHWALTLNGSLIGKSVDVATVVQGGRTIAMKAVLKKTNRATWYIDLVGSGAKESIPYPSVSGNMTMGEVAGMVKEYLNESIAEKADKVEVAPPGYSPASAGGGEKLDPQVARDVANTIAQQMGGVGALKAMAGASDFTAMSSGLGGLRFKLPTGFSAKDGERTGINVVTVLLNASDTYDIEFGGARGKTYKVIETASDIYADSLTEVFERYTGLTLAKPRVFAGGREVGAAPIDAMAAELAAIFNDKGLSAATDRFNAMAANLTVGERAALSSKFEALVGKDALAAAKTAQEDANPSAQFLAYQKAIMEGKATPGLMEEINRDERLTIREVDRLIDLAAASKPAESAAAALPQLPPAVRATLDAKMRAVKQLAEGLDIARQTDAKFNGKGRYAAEYWKGRDGDALLAAEEEILQKMLASVPSEANRAAAAAYIEANRARPALTEQEAGFFRPAEQAQQPAPVDANIGRTWTDEYGDSYEIKALSPDETRYFAARNGTSGGVYIPSDGVDKWIAADESRAKSRRDMLAAQQAEADKAAAEAAKLAERRAAAGLTKFVAGMTPANAARALKTLEKPISVRGKFKPTYEHMQDLVAEGFTVNQDGTRLANKSGSFFTSADFPVTAFNYARQLAAESPAAAAEPAADPKREADKATMQAAAAGTHPDILTPEFADELMAIAERWDGDAEMMALLEAAAVKQSELMLAHTQKLAGMR